MCQSLGYHRSVPNSSIKAIFWFVYVLDKDISLCLGRSSTLQDYDIAVGLPDISPDPKLRPWHQIIQTWVRYSRIVGQIYEQLYSVRGLSESAEVRSIKASDLALQVEHWREQERQVRIIPDVNINVARHEFSFSFLAKTYINVSQIDMSEGHHGQFTHLIASISQLSYYCLLTLIYRGAPPASNPESPAGINMLCVEAARNALHMHQQFFLGLKDGGDTFWWKGYVNW